MPIMVQGLLALALAATGDIVVTDPAVDGGYTTAGPALVTTANTAVLSAERAITCGTGMAACTDGGANSTLTINVTAGTCITANADDLALATSCAQNQTWTGAHDYGGAKLEAPNGTATTGTDCDDAAEAGRVFVDTDEAAGAKAYVCSGAGGWERVASAETGDVSAVGAGCATGACWTNGVVTAGTTVLVWEGTTDDASQITVTAAADPAAAYSIAVPSASGTIAVSATAPLAVSAAGNLSLTGNALLDASVHTDTAAGTVVRGDLIVGNSTPAWARFAKGAASTVLQMGADDPSWVANLDMATGTIQTGADDVVAYAPTECYRGTDAGAGVGWLNSISSGHLTTGLAAGATTGAPLGCALPIPQQHQGVAVKVRAATIYYALTGTAAIDETTLYVHSASAGTFTDICRITTDLSSGTSNTYTTCASGSGFPVTLAAGDALVVSLIGKTPAASTITLRGFDLTFDTD